MITSIYYYFAGDNTYWWCEALTILLDLAIIGRIYNQKGR